jgi:hypothetical protein
MENSDDKLLDSAPNLNITGSDGQLTHLIRKLRWMGMEDEARKMETQLVACGMALDQTAVVIPPEKD